MRSLNYNKGYGYDDISIRLLKICLLHCEVSFNCYQITAQSGCYQYIVKFSKELSSTQCFNFLKKIIFSVHTNKSFVHLTHVQTSYYPLFMASMLVLIKLLPLKWEHFIKALDKVWLEGLLFKLEHIGVSGNSFKKLFE